MARVRTVALALLAGALIALAGCGGHEPRRLAATFGAHRNPLTEAEVKAHLPSEVVLGSAKQTTSSSFGAGTVQEAALASGAVTAAKIGSEAIESAKIKSGAVGATQLASAAVIAGKLGAEAIEEAALKAGAVTAAKLASGAVTATKLGSEAVETSALKTEAVTEAKLAKALIEKLSPGAWKGLTLSGKVEAVTGYEEPAARPEQNNGVCRLRGAVKIKSGQEVKTSSESFMTVPTECRPKKLLEFGINVLESGGEKNHVGALKIEASGNVTDDETPVPAGVIYLLDGISYNVT